MKKQDLRKQLTEVKKEEERVWKLACKHDGLPVSTAKAIFSPMNPHKEELGRYAAQRVELTVQLRSLSA